MKGKKTFPIVLLAIWLLIVSWQYFEHRQFLMSGRESFKFRANDITNTLAVVIRSQRLFGGVIFQPRLESALYDLVQAEHLNTVVLFNSLGEVVCAAGDELSASLGDVIERGEFWDGQSVTYVNFADLGTDSSGGDDSPTIIVSDENRDMLRKMRPSRPGRDGERDVGPDSAEGDDPGRERFRRDQGFRKPHWMSDADYQSLLESSGIHGFVITMSTSPFLFVRAKELQIRGLIVILATIAIAAFWFAWRNLTKTSELQLRLVRANEMNRHLKEMNFAAAGLAHETRNPLNLVRGLAQVIAKETSSDSSVHRKVTQITEEVDRVTAQLNEFINYSKPCVPKPAPVSIASLIHDVEQALNSDLDDQQIQIITEIPDEKIEADEVMLRQVIFNLLLNAIQAIGTGGVIRIQLRESPSGCALRIEDSGPGIEEGVVEKIFQPYFTTKDKGAGLGLAVVKQIVSGHGWEIKYAPEGHEGGAFEISGIRGLAD